MVALKMMHVLIQQHQLEVTKARHVQFFELFNQFWLNCKDGQVISKYALFETPLK
jgi:hypothetical protein